MRLPNIVAAVVCLGALAAVAMDAQAAGRLGARRQLPSNVDAPWHNTYYDPAWGMPQALVVPPTAEFQTNYGWGTGNFRVTPIYPQFGVDRQLPQYDPRYFHPTPPWPSDTTQFGVNYVRGPW